MKPVRYTFPMRRIPPTIFILMLALAFSSAAIIYASDGFSAVRNTPVSVTGPNSVCKVITNTAANGVSEYIPTASVAEWQSFLAHPPAGVSLGICTCALPWGGTINDGSSVTAYLNSSGSTCPSETRTCTDTNLSGTYTHPSCTITCTGKSCGCTGKSCSDARLKREVAPLAAQDGLASILKLRPVTFRWKDVAQDAAEGEQIGFIAQEMQAVFPDLVSHLGSDIVITRPDGSRESITDPKTIQYANLVAPLVKAVQELQAENEALRARVDALEAQADH